MKQQHPILFFDGVCNLCNTSVQKIIKHDPESKLRFASLQSPIGQEFLKKNNRDAQNFDSVVYLNEQGKYFTKSDAFIEIGKKLGGLKGVLASIFGLVPKTLRDTLYDWVAKNRYAWFGKKESCWLPTPELKERFLD